MKKLKETLSVILAICFIMSETVCVLSAETRFSDMNGHWAEEYVNVLSDKDIISGMSDGKFYPDLPVTTSQFVTMLSISTFGKIKPSNGHWASGYLDYAYNNAVITEQDIALSDEPLTRLNAVRMGHNTLLYVFREADELDWRAAESLLDLYTCGSCVTNIAQLYVKGIISGRSDGLFHGDDYLSRAEAAAIVIKMIDPVLRNSKKTEAALPQATENGSITPDEVKSIIENDKSSLLIDVRSQGEYDDGHIAGSICVPLAQISGDLSKTTIPPDKNTVIIVYCQKGSRSQQAFKILKEAGYINIYNFGKIEDWPYEIETSDNLR